MDKYLERKGGGKGEMGESRERRGKEEGTSAVTETEGGVPCGIMWGGEALPEEASAETPTDEEPATCSAEGRAFQRECNGHK